MGSRPLRVILKQLGSSIAFKWLLLSLLLLSLAPAALRLRLLRLLKMGARCFRSGISGPDSDIIPASDLQSGRYHGTQGSGERVGSSCEWVLWNELDQADELQKLQLAQFYQVLTSGCCGQEASTTVHSELLQDHPDAVSRHPINLSDPAAAAESNSNSSSVTRESLTFCEPVIPRDYDGIELADPLAPGSAVDLLASFQAGLPLAEKYAAMLVAQGISVLEQEANIPTLSRPTVESPLTVVGDLHGSLEDLGEIIKRWGVPSAASRYIFNGEQLSRECRQQLRQRQQLFKGVSAAFHGSASSCRGSGSSSRGSVSSFSVSAQARRQRSRLHTVAQDTQQFIMRNDRTID